MVVPSDADVATRSGGSKRAAIGSEESGPVAAGRTRPTRDDRLAPSSAVAGHIPGLDGLRALAVLAVLVFHLWPAGLPGGFIGVDVFFVISGFLITTMLLREHDGAGRVDLLAFWVRRARRLLPALVLVVATSIVGAWLVSSDLLVGIGPQTVGALTFSANWFEISAGEDYFGATAPRLLVTFWSLAVEEQFYLFWPPLLLAILAITRTTRARVTVALVVAASSAVLMAVRFGSGANPSRAYYGTDTHLFGLMIGVALAFAFSGDAALLASRRWARARPWVGFGGLVGVIALIALLDGASAVTYRGGLVLASVLSAAMVAVLPGSTTPFTRLAELAPLEWIGQRSYGIYLWHWPVILLVTAVAPATAPGEPPSLPVVTVSLVLTFVLAALSFTWVEMPVRRQGFAAVWGVTARPAVAVGSLVVLCVLGLAIVTAPDQSAAERAVAQGQAAIAAQARPTATPTMVPPSAVTAPAGGTDVDTDEPAPGPTPAWPESEAVPSGERISAFGDSVLSGAAPAMFERFEGIAIDATPNRQWPDAPGLVAAAADGGTLRPVVVLNFGTNAGLNSDASVAALREVLELAGPARRVVVVNTVGTSRWVPETNRKLAEIAADYDNVVVADWNAVVSADPSLLHNDRTHPNMEGIGVYADLVASALDELGPV